jgi:hypothetical protein
VSVGVRFYPLLSNFCEHFVSMPDRVLLRVQDSPGCCNDPRLQ